MGVHTISSPQTTLLLGMQEDDRCPGAGEERRRLTAEGSDTAGLTDRYNKLIERLLIVQPTVRDNENRCGLEGTARPLSILIVGGVRLSASA